MPGSGGRPRARTGRRPAGRSAFAKRLRRIRRSSNARARVERRRRGIAAIRPWFWARANEGQRVEVGPRAH